MFFYHFSCSCVCLCPLSCCIYFYEFIWCCCLCCCYSPPPPSWCWCCCCWWWWRRRWWWRGWRRRWSTDFEVLGWLGRRVLQKGIQSSHSLVLFLLCFCSCSSASRWMLQVGCLIVLLVLLAIQRGPSMPSQRAKIIQSIKRKSHEPTVKFLEATARKPKGTKPRKPESHGLKS